MGLNMFGVVLWSDVDERKAVIWCEDHGDLAFYTQADCGSRVAFDPGDWVQFDLTLERNMRFAENPRLVAEGFCNGLAECLEPQKPENIRIDSASPRAVAAEIIAFSPRPAARDTGLGVAALGAR